MILPDVNVLVHAHNVDSPFHRQARDWWESCLEGKQGVGLAWVAMLGFVRITTHRRILTNPLDVDSVFERLASWLELPHVHIPHPSKNHFKDLREALSRLGTAGNLTTDAHLAMLAIDQGYVLYTTDSDFRKFPGLRWVNPCAE